MDFENSRTGLKILIKKIVEILLKEKTFKNLLNKNVNPNFAHITLISRDVTNRFFHKSNKHKPNKQSHKLSQAS